jgi:hypothetical protein
MRGSVSAIARMGGKGRKFLLIKNERGLLVLIGPPFEFIAQYNHTDLRDAAQWWREGELTDLCGGGVATVEDGNISFEFWETGILGHYDRSMSGELILQVQDQTGLSVTIEPSKNNGPAGQD